MPLCCSRRLSRLPIIWTVRSIAQGGNFRGSEEEYMELMMLGVLLGADFLEESDCSEE